MPGETISIAIADYPNLEGIAEGDDITVSGKVVSNDGEMIEIETSDVQSEMGADKAKMKRMSRQPAMENIPEEEME